VTIRSFAIATAIVLVAISASASQYPMLDAVAQRVIQRYQTSTCEQLWEARGAPKTPEQQNALQLLQGDPQMRQVFIDEIAAPVANKMFECGLIP
jgi:hypothetical protein